MIGNDFAVIIDFYFMSNVAAGVSNNDQNRPTFHIHS